MGALQTAPLDSLLVLLIQDRVYRCISRGVRGPLEEVGLFLCSKGHMELVGWMWLRLLTLPYRSTATSDCSLPEIF